MAEKYFDVVWAENGDKTAIPNANQPSGDVSYDEGFGPDFELDQVTEPSAKDVPRQETNSLYSNITSLLKELQENGIALYDATYNYLVGGRTIGSDGELYECLIINGPATTVRNPVGDLSGSWISNRADIRNYSATFDYAVGDQVKGSDLRIYQCFIINGPTSSVVDPVGDTGGTWSTVKNDVRNYIATVEYISGNYAKGVTDGILYRSTVTQTGNNPVGDISGDWVSVGGFVDAVVITEVTASDPSFVPVTGTKTMKVFVTGAGGGGGGAAGAAGGEATGATSGSGGGTAIRTIVVRDASYAIVIGAAGSGGAAGDNNGAAGGDTTFDGASVSITTGGGGVGGAGGASSAGNTTFPANGGSATNGDVNMVGGSATEATTSGTLKASRSIGGTSYWGGPSALTGATGSAAVSLGAGGNGAVDNGAGTAAGGDGAAGVVVVEQYF